MLTSRRNFLGLLAAPAIVRASSLMRVVSIDGEYLTISEIGGRTSEYVDPALNMIVGEWRGIEFYHDIPVAQFEGAAEFARNYACAEDELLRGVFA